MTSRSNLLAALCARNSCVPGIRFILGLCSQILKLSTWSQIWFVESVKLLFFEPFVSEHDAGKSQADFEPVFCHKMELRNYAQTKLHTWEGWQNILNLRCSLLPKFECLPRKCFGSLFWSSIHNVKGGQNHIRVQLQILLCPNSLVYHVACGGHPQNHVYLWILRHRAWCMTTFP